MMGEFDLDLKLMSRRLAWSQGAATRINVPLRTAVDQSRARSAYQEFTDIDVLAVSMSRNAQVHLDIFDCKTSLSRSTERMFWLAGVVELFNPTQAWLVREKEITEAARALAARLQLGTVSKNDLEILLKMYNEVEPEHPAIQRLFDRSSIEDFQGKFKNLDHNLRPLQTALRYDAWDGEPYQNLSMLPGALRRAANHLAIGNPQHVALLLDAAWLYLHALSYGAAYVARTGAHDLEARFAEFYFGGQAGIRHKEELREVFIRATGKSDVSIRPNYFPVLLEVFGRLFIEPSRLTKGMRYLEVLTAGVVAKKRPNLVETFGEEFDPVAAKYTADVLNVLIGAAGLPPSFRANLRALLLGPAPNRASTAPQATSAPPTRPPKTTSNGTEPLELELPTSKHDSPLKKD